VTRPSDTRPDITEAHARAEYARQIIAGFALAMPALARSWRQIGDALADVPALGAEVTRLDAALAADRIDRANLAAAGRATLAAWRGGEADPLSYLRDELAAQGFTGRPS
jgi:hypothetical protein